jgi:sec-independent protein translocase protein TatA
MGGFSLWHWLIVGLVILLLFGKGRFSDMMGDVAKGLKSFKKGMTEEEEEAAAATSAPPRRLNDERTIDPRPAAEPETPAAERGPTSEADRH